MEDNKKNGKNEKRNKILVGVLAVILIATLAILSYFLFFNKTSESEEKELAYTDLIKKVSDGEIEKIEMTVGSTSLKVKQKNVEEEKTVIVPNTQAFIELIQEKVAEGNNIELIQNPENIFRQAGSTAGCSFSLLHNHPSKKHCAERSRNTPFSADQDRCPALLLFLYSVVSAADNRQTILPAESSAHEA